MNEVKPIAAFSDNYIWAIVNDGNAIIIDPGDAEPVKKFLSKHELKLHAILVTHHHHDHIGGISEFKTKVYGPDNPKIPNQLKDHDQIEFPNFNLKFTVRHVPGHTLDHLIYFNKQMLFCGDTLFSAGCGRLFEGTHKQMFDSLQIIKNLDKSTNIYCSHEYTLSNLKFAKYLEPSNQEIQNRIDTCNKLRAQGLPTLPSTIATELLTNPFLRTDANEIKTRLQTKDELATFTKMRHLKDNF